MALAEPDLLTPDEVAGLLRVHVNTVYRWLQAKPPELTGLKRGRPRANGRRCWLIRRADAMALLRRPDERTDTATPRQMRTQRRSTDETLRAAGF